MKHKDWVPDHMRAYSEAVYWRTMRNKYVNQAHATYALLQEQPPEPHLRKKWRKQVAAAMESARFYHRRYMHQYRRAKNLYLRGISR
jgi:hypothetical protein